MSYNDIGHTRYWSFFIYFTRFNFRSPINVKKNVKSLLLELNCKLETLMLTLRVSVWLCERVCVTYVRDVRVVLACAYVNISMYVSTSIQTFLCKLTSSIQSFTRSSSSGIQVEMRQVFLH